MKKTIVFLLCTAAAVSLRAQDVTDALRFSKNEYYGTARTMAMGNAFTALGGDIGSMNINPAGSAVNLFSQFSITPQINVTGSSADYSSFGRVGGENPYTTDNSSQTRFTLPNTGMIINFKTGSKRGLQGVSVGLSASTVSYLNDDMSAGGSNGMTSYAGYLAALASGKFYASDKMSVADISRAFYWDKETFFWPQMVGYRSGMVNESGYGDYVGVTQGISGQGLYPVRGDLNQRYSRDSRGSRTDLLFNLGFNIDNKVFLGANLGINDLEYRFNSYMREYAENPDDFPVTVNGSTDYFRSLRFHQAYSASGSGIYGKFGIIVLPVSGLRIGAAIQTPTVNYITEHLWYSGDTQFSASSASEEISPDDEYIYEYRLISPYRVNAGIAYTIPGFGLLSADYEMADYSTMKFKEKDSSDDSAFASSNQSIKDGAGVSHMLRLGAEFILTPNWSLRAGYNLTSTPERYIDDEGAKKTPSAYTNAVSFGAGYSSGKSFFWDAALRYTMYPTEYLYPYSTYDSYASPEIAIHPHLLNIAVTFGWAF